MAPKMTSQTGSRTELHRGGRRGFTLIELLVVIVIIGMIAGIALALMNPFFKGEGVRQGAIQCQAAFQQAKLLAASLRVVHFVVFIEKVNPDGSKYGILEIHRDGDPTKNLPPNKTYDGDSDIGTADADPAIEVKPLELPRNVTFEKGTNGQPRPTWVGVFPTGYCIFDSNFGNDMSAGSFDAKAAVSAAPAGDIIIKTLNANPAETLYMCLDIDRGAGKIRRSFFHNPQGN